MVWLGHFEHQTFLMKTQLPPKATIFFILTKVLIVLYFVNAPLHFVNSHYFCQIVTIYHKKRNPSFFRFMLLVAALYHPFFYLGLWFLPYCIALLSKVLDDYPCRQPRQEMVKVCPMFLPLLPKGRYYSLTMALFSIKPRRTPRIFVNIALHERKQIWPSCSSLKT